ncbi:MAG: type IV-A pilus assembly ATPase PilB, partial [Candidatus Tectomicrobia bacterium]|nr:type IV-A pilus assembly ATPase PilB [Candidatus Tectomicrobia bacterium]
MSRLGEILVRNQIITIEQLKEALLEQKTHGGRLGSILIKKGFTTEKILMDSLSKQSGVPFKDLAEVEIDDAMIKLVESRKGLREYLLKNLIVPIQRRDRTIVIAVDDPSNQDVINRVKPILGSDVEVVLSTENAIRQFIQIHYMNPVKKEAVKTAQIDPRQFSTEDLEIDESIEAGIDQTGMVDVEEFDSLVSDVVGKLEVVEQALEEVPVENVDAPIIKLVNGILLNAVRMKASDIHVEPYEKAFRVRYRMDGVLKPVMNLPLKLKNAVTSRLKIMSRLNIAERRLPQDGRIKLRIGQRSEMDFRVSVLPTLFGEKVVLRLLDKSNLQLDMTKLGFEPEALKHFKEAIHRPYGMVLVTGPTGSGKTTTLYSALAELNKETENIMTAEDPVEFNLMGINQVQVYPQVGLTFAAALRSFLRQDPDIIMLGEIRDLETAEIAVKAALTGHLVLSTLHTNDAPSTVERLLNMGVEPFLVASSLNLILAQRLTRRICQECKGEVHLPEQGLVEVGFAPEELADLKLFKGKGCPVCNNTGYKGRVALYE